MERAAEYAAAAAGYTASPSLSSPAWRAARALETRPQAALLRDLFGNPFRPIAADARWRTPTVMPLAQAAYDERLLPSGELDPARLAVLADALEEAGCTETQILEHLRGAGPQMRGCFVINLLTGKA